MKKENIGLLLGLVGVMCFSLTLPSTSVAVAYFGPTVTGLGRTVIAAIIIAIIFVVQREKLPTRKQLKSLIIVAVGAVLGFPLLTSWAMERLPVSHGAVVLALLPLATAGIAIVRAGERPSRTFWLASFIGSGAVILYALSLGIGGFYLADLALIAAVLILGLSYAEGGNLSKEMGSWQVIAWAIVLGAPFFVVPVSLELSMAMLHAPMPAWISLLYLSVVSQFLAYVAWYGGMALGGIARVSQLQYLQPFLMIVFASLFLGESVSPLTIAVAAIVVGAVFSGKNAPVLQSESVSAEVK
ncbi:MAG: DMT family transporter [Solibacillus sp.]